MFVPPKFMLTPNLELYWNPKREKSGTEKLGIYFHCSKIKLKKYCNYSTYYPKTYNKQNFKILHYLLFQILNATL